VSEFDSDQKSGETPPNSGAGAAGSDELKAQAEKWKNDYLYLRAEFDTYKRNAIKERSEIQKYGSERVLVEVLNILDNFERALAVKVSPENIDTYVKGVEMTAHELRNLVAKFGVSEVPCHGQAFDPSFHEALSSEETQEVPEGHISKVLKKPYKLHDKVIRPGQVIVAKKPTEN
jgi:molecular chaperone GrpE